MATKKAKSAQQAKFLLVYLRQIANHHMLLSGDYCTDNFRAKPLFKQLGLQQCKTLRELVESSAKLWHLDLMLDRLLGAHKILIFSQFT